MNRRRWILGGVALVAAVGLSGCGARREFVRQERRIDAAIAAGNVEIMDFDPVVIQATVDEDGSVVTTVTDLHAIFEEGVAYYRAQDYARAIDRYDRVLRYTDDPVWIRPALFNRGLAEEGRARWEDAASDYSEVIQRWPTSRDARDAYFRLAECYAWTGAFQEVPRLMRAALQRVDLDVDKRIEALVRTGTAYFEMRRYDEAQREFNAAIQLDEADRESRMAEGRSSIRGANASGALAQANYLLGRIYHEIFAEIRMVLPVERYREDLADKDRLYQQAVDWYTRAVRTGDPYWTVHAGYMLGKINEDYYYDILASEIPSNFGAAELSYYWPGIREFIEPGMRKALRMYEAALSMGYRMGSRDPIMDEMLSSIARIDRYLSTQEGWESEQREVLEGRHSHSPFIRPGMVFRNEVETLVRDPSSIQGGE